MGFGKGFVIPVKTTSDMSIFFHNHGLDNRHPLHLQAVERSFKMCQGAVKTKQSCVREEMSVKYWTRFERSRNGRRLIFLAFLTKL